MKKFNSKFIAPALASLVLCGGALSSHAAEDILVNAFNDESEMAAWSRWWGGAPYTIEFDPSQDSEGDENSGALKFTVDFDAAAYGGDNQYSFLNNLPAVVNGLEYEKLVMDIKFDPSSATRGTGDYGYLEFGIRRNPDWGQNYFGNATIAETEEGWVRLEANVPANYDGIDQLAGITIKTWAGGDNSITGTQTFWLDNIRLIAKEDNTPIDPPTLSITKATPGLSLITSRPAAQYQRQNLRTRNTYYSWIGASEPVTYSMTINEFPDAASYSGFQAHMILVPAGTMGVDSAPDWSQPNVIFVQIGANADGSGYANFRYKTNQPNANGMFWNGDETAGPVGYLGTTGSATVLGTWSLTFNSDTEATLTSPDGTSNTFTLSEENAALFADPLYAYFGVQPNEVANIGQQVNISKIAITGVSAPIDETFANPTLDVETWEVAADDAPGVTYVSNEPSWWLQWTLPAPGVTLQASIDLNTWTTITAPAPQVGDVKKALVTASSVRLPAAEGEEEGAISPYGFFRLAPPIEPPAGE